MRDLLLAVHLVLGGNALILGWALVIGSGVLLAFVGLRAGWRALDRHAEARIARATREALDPQWLVWDDEAEAGMTDRQVQMLRDGYVLLPEDLPPLANRTADIVIDDDTDYPGSSMPPRPPGISQYPPFVPRPPADYLRRFPQQRDGGDRS